MEKRDQICGSVDQLKALKGFVMMPVECDNLEVSLKPSVNVHVLETWYHCQNEFLHLDHC